MTRIAAIYTLYATAGFLAGFFFRLVDSPVATLAYVTFMLALALLVSLLDKMINELLRKDE